MPHLEQTWNSAVLVPKKYLETRFGSLTKTVSEPAGQDVHMPPCFTQNEHEHALAGISFGSGCQSRLKETLPQWQAPEMSMVVRLWVASLLPLKDVLLADTQVL